MCAFWDAIRNRLRKGSILHRTKFGSTYKFEKFIHNQSKEVALQYSIPKRDNTGFNYKSIPQKVFCNAKKDQVDGFSIDTQWLKKNFEDIHKAGGCNIKVLQGVLYKIK